MTTEHYGPLVKAKGKQLDAQIIVNWIIAQVNSGKVVSFEPDGFGPNTITIMVNGCEISHCGIPDGSADVLVAMMARAAR